MKESDISKHVGRVHEKKKKESVQCPHCVCVLSSSHFTYHMENHHADGLPFGCDFCGYRGLTELVIKTHVARQHSENQKKHPCKWQMYGCKILFKQGYTRNKHSKYNCDFNPEGKMKDKAESQKTKESNRQKKVKMVNLNLE